VRPTIVLVDRQPSLDDSTWQAFARLGWTLEVAAVDALDYLEHGPPADVVLANLFLHHFPDAALARIFSAAARSTAYFAACEPRRGMPGAVASRLLGVLGCNDITRHDARISVRAGFRGDELSRLWPNAGWRLHEAYAPPFTHTFTARREGPA
jgi:hypothetical protein